MEESSSASIPPRTLNKQPPRELTPHTSKPVGRNQRRPGEISPRTQAFSTRTHGRGEDPDIYLTHCPYRYANVCPRKKWERTKSQYNMQLETLGETGGTSTVE